MDVIGIPMTEEKIFITENQIDDIVFFIILIYNPLTFQTKGG